MSHSPETHDWILLEGIAAECLVGVYDFERHAPRPLRIDVALACDLRSAGRSDEVADTIDYDAVTALIRQSCERLRPALIERLAEDIAARLLASFPVRGLRLTVHKPGAVAGVDDIAIRIERWHKPH